MKYVFVAVLAILASPSFADELDDGYAACLPNRVIVVRAVQSPWNAGWEHCTAIVHAWGERRASRDAADETANPSLKMTRDLAKKLQSGEASK
jgi:hypothetical protein